MEINFIIGNSIYDAINSVKKNKIGYAGLKTKKYLKESLEWNKFEIEFVQFGFIRVFR